MILSPAPLHKAASKALLPRGAMPAPARSGVALRPVLQTTRAPQQLCLDLQPRLR